MHGGIQKSKSFDETNVSKLVQMRNMEENISRFQGKNQTFWNEVKNTVNIINYINKNIYANLLKRERVILMRRKEELRETWKDYMKISVTSLTKEKRS